MFGKPQDRRAHAREYILAHPDQTKAEQAKGANVATRTIAIARAELIAEGRLAPSRKTPYSAINPRPREGTLLTPPPPSVTVSKPAGMLDHEAMLAMADMMKELDDLDDEEVQRRLLKQCLTFAFNPQLHPDTRMSASQMWAKLRDQAKTKDLGPGPPLTFEDAVARLSDIMIATGAKITMAAINVAFDTKEPTDEGKLPPDTGEAAPDSPRTTPAP